MAFRIASARRINYRAPQGKPLNPKNPEMFLLTISTACWSITLRKMTCRKVSRSLERRSCDSLFDKTCALVVVHLSKVAQSAAVRRSSGISCGQWAVQLPVPGMAGHQTSGGCLWLGSGLLSKGILNHQVGLTRKNALYICFIMNSPLVLRHHVLSIYTKSFDSSRG